MTPRATFYPKPETNFNTADLWLSPTYKMASWSLKRRMCGLWSLCNSKCIAQKKDVPSVIKFLKSVYSYYTIQFLKLLTFSPQILVLAYSETLYLLSFCFLVFLFFLIHVILIIRRVLFMWHNHIQNIKKLYQILDSFV